MHGQRPPFPPATLWPVATAGTSRFSLTTWMVGGFVVVLLVVGLVIALLLSSMGALRSANRELQRSERALTFAFAAEKSLVDIETGLRGYLVTRQDDVLGPWRSGRVDAPRRLRALLEQVRDPAQKGRVRTIADRVDAFISGYAVPLERRARAGGGEARAL